MSEGELVGLMSEIVEQKWLDLHPDAYAAPKPGPLEGAPLSARHRASQSNLRDLPEVLRGRFTTPSVTTSAEC